MKRLGCLFLVILLLLIASTTCAQEETKSRILIAYFTWAENAISQNAENFSKQYAAIEGSTGSMDATSSASLMVPGNTAMMANYIQQLTGGDLFSIQTADPYPNNYDDCLNRAADELDDDARPELRHQVESMEQYDVIFLGMPNWWYSCPRAILTFVESNDFHGKTVIPFVSHGTGGISGSVRDMSAALPEDCTVLTPIGIYRLDIPSCQPAIEDWLIELGFLSDRTSENP